MLFKKFAFWLKSGSWKKLFWSDKLIDLDQDHNLGRSATQHEWKRTTSDIKNSAVHSIWTWKCKNYTMPVLRIHTHTFCRAILDKNIQIKWQRKSGWRGGEALQMSIPGFYVLTLLERQSPPLQGSIPTTAVQKIFTLFYDFRCWQRDS